MTLLWLLAWALSAFVALAAAYRAVLATAYLTTRAKGEAKDRALRTRRFAVVIPAHDEELLVARTIETILATDYPADAVRVLVVADNCTDATASVARDAGATVYERTDPDHPGKGQALDWLLAHADLSGFDAIAVIDADCVVDRAFLAEMNRALGDGGRCLQGYNDIANPGDSPLTRLVSVTHVMKNLLWNGGKAALGLPVTLMGTGMVFAREVIETGWQAGSIGEDLEQTLELLERGERVRFVERARVAARDSTTLSAAYGQRQRWATGRRALAARARAAVLGGLRARDFARVDVGVDLLMPTYSRHLYLSLAAVALGALALPGWGPLATASAALVYQIAEIAVATRLMRPEPGFAASLALAPAFLAWKAVIDLLALVGFRRDAWTRASRTPPPS